MERKKCSCKTMWIANIRKTKYFEHGYIDILLMVFETNGFYPTSMSHKEAIHPKIESGYAFKKELNDEYVIAYRNQSFARSRTLFTIKSFNPKVVVFQHIPVKKKKKKI